MSNEVKQHLKVLINKVNNPNKFLWFANVPGAFDAAEYLMNNHWEDLSSKTQIAIEKILIHSGKYEAA